MTWGMVLALAVGTLALKAVGPLLAGGRALPPRAAAAFALLPAALLAALVATQTFGDGQALTLDARAAGVGVAAVAAWRRAPFIVVVILGAVTAATLRMLGLP
ncbi:MAG: AzlD domain-containing protein [Nitriliruptorales bacterium]|nr:AzlD domain-containing protein [Nitriliruptorales bacterium]